MTLYEVLSGQGALYTPQAFALLVALAAVLIWLALARRGRPRRYSGGWTATWTSGPPWWSPRCAAPWASA